MAEKMKRRIQIRLDDETYQLLESISVKRGESISLVARNILSNKLQSESALDAQDVLTSVVRKTISQELKSTENRLSKVVAKGAISSATVENLALYIIKLLNEPNISGVRDACRKRGVAYIKEPISQILKAYEGEAGD